MPYLPGLLCLWPLQGRPLPPPLPSLEGSGRPHESAHSVTFVLEHFRQHFSFEGATRKQKRQGW